ncbi:Diguanylate cyclase [Vibrio crassostreae]|uniref:sensor domain-containing diguanylate cyclase n=1 Tax=Vibrio crassostreae TaxID=246167 RepID=UPI001BD43F02|nr:diguanylate cyclase [Vibrio crassostreae]CAK1708225.1 Diguanylate cyclase [Vibrio crassostreae]CAK2043955.1 Diguanylate cyclase [Vibrio crassostreae]CAK2308444.1 Diguanylate cyclase [Vibrio crassostreae]CAK2358362.1 Diguanylate cyclase [Vibrio crassostreae]CAK2390301.1 Diguanylate cyclase [Vibrio crassostreae]
MNQASESEIVIRRLYQITNDYRKGFDSQIAQLLIMGLERFNLDIGILSKVDGNTYLVEHCVTPEGVELNSGDTFDYRSTYCEITCKSISPICIEHCGKHDKYATHPAYQSFGLESYIGIPIFVNDELYGTLNFSSPAPYHREFKEFDIDVMRLMASWIEVELVRRQQERKLKELNEKLEYQALYDPLTHLPNRRCLFKTLNAEVEQLKGSLGKGTLAVVDIDFFKVVNDTYGHQMGDVVLKKVANVLSHNTQEGEFVARFGGEEFILWYPNRTPSYVEDKFMILLQEMKKITLDRKPVTVSIGACHFELSTGDTKGERMSALDSLIKVADECLYIAKQNGRDQFISRPYHQEHSGS